MVLAASEVAEFEAIAIFEPSEALEVLASLISPSALYPYLLWFQFVSHVA